MNIPFWFHISFHVDSALHPNDCLCPPKMKNLIILLVRGSQENNESVYLYLYNAAGCFSFAQHITHETCWEVKWAKSPILAKQISFFLPSNILLKVCAGPRGDRRLLFKHRMMSKHFHSGGKKRAAASSAGLIQFWQHFRFITVIFQVHNETSCRSMGLF